MVEVGCLLVKVNMDDDDVTGSFSVVGVHGKFRVPRG